MKSFLLLQANFDFIFLFNPLTLRSDLHLISPYHISPELNIKVRRIKELITD